MPERPAQHTVAIGQQPPPPRIAGDLSYTVLLSALGSPPQQQPDGSSAEPLVSSAEDMASAAKAAAARQPRVPQPSRLGTLEFKLYYLLYLVVVPSMAYTAYQASSPARPEYAAYESNLSPGWMLGRKVDLSDGQWRTFRQHLPEFAVAMLAYVALNWAARWATRHSKAAGALPSLWFPGIFATVFVVVLSGASIVFIAALVAGNYVLAKRAAGRWWAPWSVWACNIAMLFANEYGDGYSFGRIHPDLAWLDAHRGILRRWDVTFNITMLRMISFAMDYHWSKQQQQQGGAVSPPREQSARDRIERSCAESEYCFVNYWAYLLYPPLYLTGPIVTYNDFVSQMRRPVPPSAKSTVLY
ncbi:glycerol transporter, partial [Coemansia spiralis]